ncbi:capsular biosynthesis protein [Candidatus Woesearchaeota archaeon]|nr:MAG: capsular biosynthesis protein [Candidatus Woesearchaeota archaeon]
MVIENNVIVIDLDGTLCKHKCPDEDYSAILPNVEILNKLKEYKDKGFYIIIDTARNMKTHKANIGRINAITLKKIFSWLDKHEVPYDEIHTGKPWCGHNGFYIDDKAIRPSEFIDKSFDEIHEILKKEIN